MAGPEGPSSPIHQDHGHVVEPADRGASLSRGLACSLGSTRASPEKLAEDAPGGLGSISPSAIPELEPARHFWRRLWAISNCWAGQPCYSDRVCWLTPAGLLRRLMSSIAALRVLIRPPQHQR